MSPPSRKFPARLLPSSLLFSKKHSDIESRPDHSEESKESVAQQLLDSKEKTANGGRSKAIHNGCKSTTNHIDRINLEELEDFNDVSNGLLPPSARGHVKDDDRTESERSDLRLI